MTRRHGTVAANGYLVNGGLFKGSGTGPAIIGKAEDDLANNLAETTEYGGMCSLIVIRLGRSARS